MNLACLLILQLLGKKIVFYLLPGFNKSINNESLGVKINVNQKKVLIQMIKFNLLLMQFMPFLMLYK